MREKARDVHEQITTSGHLCYGPFVADTKQVFWHSVKFCFSWNVENVERRIMVSYLSCYV